MGAAIDKSSRRNYNYSKCLSLYWTQSLWPARVAETNKYTKIAPDFGLSSRRAKGSIFFICEFWRNAEDGTKDKSAVAD